MPVCRTHVDPLFRFRVDPATEDVAAWKHQRVRLTGRVKDGKLKVAVERRGGDRLPLHIQLI